MSEETRNHGIDFVPLVGQGAVPTPLRDLYELRDLSLKLSETFDPGGNLPADCEEWATEHEAVCDEMRLLIMGLVATAEEAARAALAVCGEPREVKIGYVVTENERLRAEVYELKTEVSRLRAVSGEPTVTAQAPPRNLTPGQFNEKGLWLDADEFAVAVAPPLSANEVERRLQSLTADFEYCLITSGGRLFTEARAVFLANLKASLSACVVSGEPTQTSDVRQALEDLRFARSSHLDWAEHLEAHVVSGVPCEQCEDKPYKLNAEHEREWVAKYDNIIAIVQRAVSGEPPPTNLSESVIGGTELEGLAGKPPLPAHRLSVTSQRIDSDKRQPNRNEKGSVVAGETSESARPTASKDVVEAVDAGDSVGSLELRVQHARKQGAADGFQDGWHAALQRIREGDRLHDLSELVPKRAVSGEAPSHQACPCLHTTPCDPRCTCVDPVSSRGCRRCCSYGSSEQQKARAEHLVAVSGEAHPQPLVHLDYGKEAVCQIESDDFQFSTNPEHVNCLACLQIALGSFINGAASGDTGTPKESAK